MLLAKRHQLIALCPIPLAGGTPSIDKSMALSQVFEVFETIGGILIGREMGGGDECPIAIGTFDLVYVISCYFDHGYLVF